MFPQPALDGELPPAQAEHIAHLLAWAIEADRSVQQMLDSPFYHPVIEEGVRTALPGFVQARGALRHEVLPLLDG